MVFSSADLPGIIPDHIVVTRDMVTEQPKVAQKLVDAWYDTLDYIAANPDEAVAIMAEDAGISTGEYEDLASGTKLFTVDDALTAFQPGTDTTSLMHTAKLINPFMVKSGLTEKKASLKGLFAPQFTRTYAESAPGA